MLLKKILDVLDSIAPLRFAEAWDNVGLLAGDPGSEITRVLLAIDATSAVFDEAKSAGAELLVAYHPPLFEAIKRVRHDSLIYRAIRDGIAIYSPHTALDVAPGGTNDMLADVLGMTSREPLRLTPTKDTAHPLVTSVPAAAPEGIGIGRVGTLDVPIDRGALFDKIKKALGIGALLVAGPLEGPVKTAAVCAGAGRSLLDDAIARRVDLFLTGELPHHDALRAAKAGVTVACALHSNSERAALQGLRRRLEEALPDLTIEVSAEDRDPFTVR